VPSLRLPRELYQFLPALYPRLLEVLRSAGLTANEAFVLSYIKNVGKEVTPGVHAMPIADLRVVVQKLGYSAAGAGGFITTNLEKRRKLVTLQRLSPEEKLEFFPDSPGYRDAVIVTELGMSKLREVRQGLEELLGAASSGLKSRVALRGLLGALAAIVGELVPRLNAPPRSKRHL